MEEHKMSESKQQIKHSLFGNQWSYNDLKAFETIKVYKNTSHDVRALEKSPDGQLFLYDFHEKMGFPDDEIIEHFFLVESEEEAEKLSNAHVFTLKSENRKWIHIDSDYTISQVG